MEYGDQLFIFVLNCLFLKLILASNAQLDYNSIEDKDLFGYFFLLHTVPCIFLESKYTIHKYLYSLPTSTLLDAIKEKSLNEHMATKIGVMRSMFFSLIRIFTL